MCCSTAAFTQIKYDVVNTYAVQHHFVGYNRHTVKKIFGLYYFKVFVLAQYYLFRLKAEKRLEKIVKQK